MIKMPEREKCKANKTGSIYQIDDLKLLLPWLIVFLFTVFSGAIRKWGVNSNMVGNVFLGIQLMIPLFLLFQQRHIVSHFYYKPVFQLYLFFLVFLAIHPLNLTLGHGVLGFFLYSSVWIILYAYLKVRKQLPIENLDIIVGVVLIIELIMSNLQYYLPENHILNIYATGAESSAGVGDAVRATGTFSYLGGLQGFVIFWGFFSWYTLIRYKNIWIISFVVIGGIVCTLFTGSRGAVLQYLILLFIGMVSSGFLSKYFLKILGVFTFIGISYFFFPNFFVFDVVSESSENFEERYDSGVESGEMNRRIESQYLGAFYYHGDHPIFGVGLGSTYQGAIAVFGISSYVANYGYFEDEGERIVIEGGYTLYFFRLIIFILFLSALYMPAWSKVLIFVLFSNAVLTFNIYIAIFFAFGLIWVDRAYYLNKQSSSNIQRNNLNAA